MRQGINFNYKGDFDMSENVDIDIAKIILNKSGILENRALIVHELEEELATIYSELDNSIEKNDSDTPIRYSSDVQTEFDLISNNEIHRSLYKVQTKEQRLFLRKITHHEDFYFTVTRGEGFNFVQEWDFNLLLKKEDFMFDYNRNFSFKIMVGVRDIFPYEIETYSYIDDIDQPIILKYYYNL